MDVRAYNRKAWNRQVEKGNQWTLPVSSDVIKAAREGVWEVYLTPTKSVPREWFPEISGCDLLCLASGGGQQGPIFAAAGANVTVFDNSPRQLEQDLMVAERDDLKLQTFEGDMANLSIFPDQRFDLIFHPVSNVFAPEVIPVWQECYRVLKSGGVLLAGITNPFLYLFDWELLDEKGIMKVKHSLPYSDLESLPKDTLKRHMDAGDPLEYSHTLEEQIGGQLEAGFVLTRFYEDSWSEDTILDDYFDSFIATRAVKLD